MAILVLGLIDLSCHWLSKARQGFNRSLVVLWLLDIFTVIKKTFLTIFSKFCCFQLLISRLTDHLSKYVGPYNYFESVSSGVQN